MVFCHSVLSFNLSTACKKVIFVKPLYRTFFFIKKDELSHEKVKIYYREQLSLWPKHALDLFGLALA